MNYIEEYRKATGRNYEEDRNNAFTEFFNLTNYLKKYGIISSELCLDLWHHGVTAEMVQQLEATHTEWEILDTLATQLAKPRCKEMPLVAAGIIKPDEEN